METNVFLELDEKEYDVINGGSPEAAAAVLVIGGAVVTGVVSPLACVASGCNPVVFGVGVATGTALMLQGAQIAAEAKKK